MDKYWSFEAVLAMDDISIAAYINEHMKSLLEQGDFGGEPHEDRLRLEKLQQLKKLNAIVPLDTRAVITYSGGKYFDKYFNSIESLLAKKQYEEARLLCILEIKGIEAYLSSGTKKYKYIWPQYIASNRWRTKRTKPRKITTACIFESFICLLKDGIVTLALCAKYPFCFKFFARCLVVTEGYFKAVVECKKLARHQRRDLIAFLVQDLSYIDQQRQVSRDYSVDEIYKLWYYSGASIYREMLPSALMFSLEPESVGDFDFVYHVAKSRKLTLLKVLSCYRPKRVFELINSVYPIEYLLAREETRKAWKQSFGRWCTEEVQWKHENLHYLKHNLKKVSPEDALFFHATMLLEHETIKHYLALNKGHYVEQRNDTSTSFPLSELPFDIIHVISKNLSLTSVMALTLTCKAVNQSVKMNADLFWKKSLAVTQPLMNFPQDGKNNSFNLARQHSKLQQNWQLGRSSVIIEEAFSDFNDCKFMDENWAVLSGRNKDCLLNCHTGQLILEKHITMSGVSSMALIDSNPNSLPLIVGYTIGYPEKDEIQVFNGEEVMRQQLLGVVKNLAPLECQQILVNNYIWDLNKAKVVKKFDFEVRTQRHSIYNKKLQSVLHSEKNLHILDIRSGEDIEYKDLIIGRFQMIDDNTLGFVNINGNDKDLGVGTMDLRMMKREFMDYQPPFKGISEVLISGAVGKALLQNHDNIVLRWDFRERLWERAFYTPGWLAGFNSKYLAVTIAHHAAFWRF